MGVAKGRADCLLLSGATPMGSVWGGDVPAHGFSRGLGQRSRYAAVTDGVSLDGV